MSAMQFGIRDVMAAKDLERKMERETHRLQRTGRPVTVTVRVPRVRQSVPATAAVAPKEHACSPSARKTLREAGRFQRKRSP